MVKLQILILQQNWNQTSQNVFLNVFLNFKRNLLFINNWLTVKCAELYFSLLYQGSNYRLLSNRGYFLLKFNCASCKIDKVLIPCRCCCSEMSHKIGSLKNFAKVYLQHWFSVNKIPKVVFRWINEHWKT